MKEIFAAIGLATTLSVAFAGCLVAWHCWQDRRESKRRDAQAVDRLIRFSAVPSSWVHVGKGEK